MNSQRIQYSASPLDGMSQPQELSWPCGEELWFLTKGETGLKNRIAKLCHLHGNCPLFYLLGLEGFLLCFSWRLGLYMAGRGQVGVEGF